jgi:hypothetical protein
MTTMLDILEDFLFYLGYKYARYVFDQSFVSSVLKYYAWIIFVSS